MSLSHDISFCLDSYRSLSPSERRIFALSESPCVRPSFWTNFLASLNFSSALRYERIQKFVKIEKIKEINNHDVDVAIFLTSLDLRSLSLLSFFLLFFRLLFILIWISSLFFLLHEGGSLSIVLFELLINLNYLLNLYWFLVW